MSNFLKAAASYYGLADTNVVDSELVSQAGTYITFRIAVSDEDLYGVLARMKAMQEQMPAGAPSEPVALPNEGRMRDEYNGMDKRTKSEFGSFSRYKAWRLGQAMDEVVAGPVDEAPSLPAYVYLSPREATPQQKAMAVGMDEKGNYAVAVEDLTEEQRINRAPRVDDLRAGAAVAYDGTNAAEVLQDRGVMAKPADAMRAGYVERTVAATDRLTGADGKPTSNATDFGGLPG